MTVRFEESAEGWALRYLTTTELAQKFEAIPWQTMPFMTGLIPSAPAAPARPPEIHVHDAPKKAKKGNQLQNAKARAELFHRFLHHEMQAAELFAWAILRFPDAPQDFRRGLLRIADDEIRHMRLYRDYLQMLDTSVGAFPVRDWFWERVPHAKDPAAFVATLGIGFEGANLDHTARYVELFVNQRDAEAARVQRTVGYEEIAHCRFACKWYVQFTCAVELEFDAWAQHLPEPLSPILMRGPALERKVRNEAGFPEAFQDRLASYAFVKNREPARALAPLLEKEVGGTL
jgi:uncharacterized ferritin-like protein (DUF455 family)